MGHTSELSDWVRETLLEWLHIAENKGCLVSPLGRLALWIQGLRDPKRDMRLHTAAFGIRQLCSDTVSPTARSGVSAPCCPRTAAKALLWELEGVSRYVIPAAQWNVQKTLASLRTIAHAR